MISPEMNRRLERQVPSVDRALDLLELLACSARGLSLSELSRRLRIPKSSVHYLIGTLLRRGYLERNPCGRDYSIGLRVAAFANTRVFKSRLRAVCSPYLEKIAEQLGLTAAVGILDGSEGLVIDVQAPTDIKFESWAGRHFDLHCSALGKALITQFSNAELEKLFQGRGLAKHNLNTLCSLEALKGHLAAARAKGFATNNEELDIGIRCAGAPIFNSAGSVVAAVSVGSSTGKVASWQLPKLGDKIAAVARDISRTLCDSPLLPGEFLLSSDTGSGVS